MPVKSNIRAPYDLQVNVEHAFLYANSFDTNGTSPPDGLDMADGVTVARTGVGDYTVTFPADKRPKKMLYGDASFRGNQAELDAKVVSYTPSTGVLLLAAYDEDDTSGISASADSTDRKIQFWGIFTYHDGGSAT